MKDALILVLVLMVILLLMVTSAYNMEIKQLKAYTQLQKIQLETYSITKD